MPAADAVRSEDVSGSGEDGIGQDGEDPRIAAFAAQLRACFGARAAAIAERHASDTEADEAIRATWRTIVRIVAG